MTVLTSGDVKVIIDALTTQYLYKRISEKEYKQLMQKLKPRKHK